jgi:hypothetical protein
MEMLENMNGKSKMMSVMEAGRKKTLKGDSEGGRFKM